MVLSLLNLGLLNLGLIGFSFGVGLLTAAPTLGLPGTNRPIQPLLVQAPTATQAGKALLALPRPTGVPATLKLMFMANAFDQQGLNFQYKAKPDAAAQFYQTQLTSKGYTERAVNRTSGAWGFSMVFDPAQPLAAKTAGKTVVLVVQGTAISADTMNINARFEEI